MSLSHNQLVRGMQVVNHLIGFFGIYHVFTTGEWYWLGYTVLAWWFTGILGIDVALHRYISHGSFKTYKPVEWFLGFISVLTVVGSPLAWSAVHRQHHKTPEHEGDPHSPYRLGKFNAWFGFWEYTNFSPRMVHDIRKNKFYAFLHKHYLAVNVVWALLLGLINPWFVVFLYAIPACLCMHASSAIIVIAHYHGYKSHYCDDESRNSWICNIITMGEGWHNNHHAKPWAWSNWEQWWEWDIPAIIIRCIMIESDPEKKKIIGVKTLS